MLRVLLLTLCLAISPQKLAATSNSNIEGADVTPKVHPLESLPTDVLGLVLEYTDQSAAQLMTVCRKWKTAVDKRLTVETSRFTLNGRIRFLKAQVVRAVEEHIKQLKKDPKTEKGVGKATLCLHLCLDLIENHLDVLYPNWKLTDYFQDQVDVLFPRLSMVTQAPSLPDFMEIYYAVFILESTYRHLRFQPCKDYRDPAYQTDSHRQPSRPHQDKFDQLRSLLNQPQLLHENRFGELYYELYKRFRRDDLLPYVFEPVELNYNRIFQEFESVTLSDNDLYLNLYNIRAKTPEYRAYSNKKIGDHFFLQKRWSEAVKYYRYSAHELSGILKHNSRGYKSTQKLFHNKTSHYEEWNIKFIQKFPDIMKYFLDQRTDWTSRSLTTQIEIIDKCLILNYLKCLLNLLDCYHQLKIPGQSKLILDSIMKGKLVFRNAKGELEISEDEDGEKYKIVFLERFRTETVSLYEGLILALGRQNRHAEILEHFEIELRHLYTYTKKNKGLKSETYDIIAKAYEDKGFNNDAKNWKSLKPMECVMM